MIADILVSPEGRPPLVSTIQSVVAEYFGLPLIAMKSRRGSLSVARPRQIAMFLARELTVHSLPEIGRYFGGRDHTTVIHAIRRITGLCATEPPVAHDVAMLRQRIQNPGQFLMAV